MISSKFKIEYDGKFVFNDMTIRLGDLFYTTASKWPQGSVSLCIFFSHGIQFLKKESRLTDPIKINDSRDIHPFGG